MKFLHCKMVDGEHYEDAPDYVFDLEKVVSFKKSRVYGKGGWMGVPSLRFVRQHPDAPDVTVWIRWDDFLKLVKVTAAPKFVPLFK